MKEEGVVLYSIFRNDFVIFIDIIKGIIDINNYKELSNLFNNYYDINKLLIKIDKQMNLLYIYEIPISMIEIKKIANRLNIKYFMIPNLRIINDIIKYEEIQDKGTYMKIKTKFIDGDIECYHTKIIKYKDKYEYQGNINIIGDLFITITNGNNYITYIPGEYHNESYLLIKEVS